MDDFKHLLEQLKWPKSRSFWIKLKEDDETEIPISKNPNTFPFVNESRDVPNPPYDCFFTSIALNYSLQSTPCFFTDLCFKNNIEFQGGEILSTSEVSPLGRSLSSSPEECHNLCQNYTHCAAFTWYGNESLQCQLWSNNSPTFKWVPVQEVVSGPRNCTYDTCLLYTSPSPRD